MKTLSTIAAALLACCALTVGITAPAGAKTPPPVAITVAPTCVVSGLMPSDYHAVVTLASATVTAVDLHSDGKGLLATNVAVPSNTFSYFGPVGVKTDDVTATLPGTSTVVGTFQVKSPCVKPPQGQA